MHPALNYRQSRRSACDRCRGFKLRCERDQVNGRSCERCLKAQVMCTTSINHPASNYLSSKNRSCSFPGEYDQRFMHVGSDRLAMPVLHKPSISKVRKAVSPGNIRRHENLAFESWPYSDPFSSWVSGDMVPFGGDPDPQMMSYPGTTFPFEQWTEQQPTWPTRNNFPPAPVEDFILESNYRPDHQTSAPDQIVSVSSYNTQDDSQTVTTASLPETQSLLGPGSMSMTDDSWEFPWLQTSGTGITEDDKHMEFSTEWTLPNFNDLRKRLLKLNLEFTDDLELLETESKLFRFSPFLRDNISSSVSKLDLPISRMLNHSTHFLEMLRPAANTSDSSQRLLPSIEFSHTGLDIFDDTKPLSLRSGDGGLEEVATTASHDSGYHTIFTSPLGQETSTALNKYDISTSLTILTTYCQLIKLYRSVFNQLYQLLLIAPPADMSSLLLFPSLQFGQYNMEGNLGMQVQALVDLVLNMLEKIERVLGVSQDSSGDMSSAPSILENSLLASIRDNVITQEQIECGVSLKDILGCLRRLVKDTACV
ncbi:uncharacterized protein N7483_009628 [Penicillium malachiteum]|uniref:uncharacterized protein n=1 Tax=Penicillium malachiteum TaxID=1324776 RepID=UPI0025479E0D|nr:uncharacterized protein N7483_009628 [Penicillium malachiteum]KAJ5721694.1 hypothetical protein N7483_009628 [Penicillium malachiteum]